VRRPSILSSQPLPSPCPSRCQPQSPLAVGSHPAPRRPSISAHTNPADHGTDVVGIRSSAVCGPGPSRCIEDSRGAALQLSIYRILLNRRQIWDGQKAIRNAEDIVELETSFSNLLTVLQLPLRKFLKTWTPALRKRVEDLSRLLQFLSSHVYVAER